MEEDQGDADGKNKLCPDPLKRVLHEPQDRRSDQGPHRDEHHHLGQPQQDRYRLRDQPRPYDEAEIPEYLLGALH